jgi:hypothetical protein
VIPDILKLASPGETGPRSEIPEGMGWRVSISIITFFGGVVAAILWLFFYAGSYNIYQNLAIIVVIFLIFVGVMAAVWASWGMKQGRAWWDWSR